MKRPVIIEDARPASAGGASSSRLDDLAYVLPMAAFMLFIWVGGLRWPHLYPASYVGRTLIVAALLAYFWRRYTKIDWSRWRLGVAVGVIGVVQWVGTEKLLLHVWPNYPRMGGDDPFKPFDYFSSGAAAWAFIAVRWAGSSLVVPVMEELFWRDWLWRTAVAPSDFKLARVGEWDRVAFVVVVALFATVHPQWITSIVWAVLIGLLLVRTGSLGACVVAHGVTNFLLGLYVLVGHFALNRDEWFFW